MRQRNLVDGRPQRAIDVDRTPHTLLDLGVESRAEVLPGNANLEPCQRLLERGRVAGDVAGNRCGIAGIVPGDRLKQCRCSRDVGRHGADLIERTGVGHQSVPRDPPVGGLQPHNPAQTGRLPDRAPRVTPQGQRGHAGRDRRCRATARTPGGPLQIPGVGGFLVRRILGGRAHRELVHVHLAHQHRIGGSQLADDVGVIRRDKVPQHLAGTGCGLPGDADHILDRDGNTGERPQRSSRGPATVDLGGLCERSLTIDMQERLDVAIAASDLVQ